MVIFFFFNFEKVRLHIANDFLNLNILRQEIYLNEKNNSDGPLIIGW